jgi:uridine kinase
MSKSKAREIKETSRRSTVQIHLPGGRILEGPAGSQVGDFLSVLETPAPVVGAVVNRELRELTYPIEMDAHVRPVSMAEPDGMRIYRRSLTFLLAAAFDDLFPDEKLVVDHSVSSGGYYCQIAGRDAISAQELAELEKHMQAMVDEDLPFAKTQTTLEEAIRHFEAHGFDDKVRLLAHRRKPHLVLYSLGDHRDYHHGYMVPSTGFLKWFGLTVTNGGFTLRFPRRHRPTELLPLPEYPKLLATFREYGDWLERLGISSIGSYRLVLIAGPSASGKTTFSKRLTIQLLACGLSPFPVGLDNFFVDRELTPRDESGEFDYEALGAIDLMRLNHDLNKLVGGAKVQLPKYDFLTGKQDEGEIVQLNPDQIVILEGIHGLNPELVAEIPAENTFRIYVSALTQLNLDRLNRVSTTDTRLVRRIVRDATQRGYTAAETIRRWESVRRGEKRYIFPYQENADVMFNSALMYEGAALAPLAEPLIRQVPFGSVEHVEAKRLLAFLEWFLPIDTELIPDNSLMREFIGGSILADFVPWKTI